MIYKEYVNPHGAEFRNVRSHWFETMDEIKDRCQSERNDLLWTHEMQGKTSWRGCSVNEMNHWLKAGWPDGLAKLQRMLDDLGPLDIMPANARVRRRKKVRGDHGDVLHMPRVWNGDTEHAWDLMHKTPLNVQTTRFVSMFININQSAMVGWEAAMWRAAAIVKIVDAMQRSGRMVRIVIGSVASAVTQDEEYGIHSMDNLNVFGVKVKDYSEQLSMQHLALMSTSMFFRTYGFRMYCHSKYRTHGYMGLITREHLARKIFPHTMLEDELERGAMLVRFDYCFSKEAAIKQCEDVARQLVTEEKDRYGDSGTNEGDQWNVIYSNKQVNI